MIVLLDACVIYPAMLRDTLMRLAVEEVFQAHWTEIIHDEWIRNLLNNRPELTLKQLRHVANLMNTHVPRAVVKEFEHRIESLQLPDSEDRHVLAAAIHIGATYIVTFNHRDFPASALDPYGIQTIGPDALIVKLFEIQPEHVLNAFRIQRSSLRNPTMNADQFSDKLEAKNMEKTAQILRNHKNMI